MLCVSSDSLILSVSKDSSIFDMPEIFSILLLWALVKIPAVLLVDDTWSVNVRISLDVDSFKAS